MFPVFLSAVKAWTLADDKIVYTFETLVRRRILQILWGNKSKNWICVRRQSWKILRHVARRNEENLEKGILLGRTPGSIGEKKIRWAQSIKAQMRSVALTAKKV